MAATPAARATPPTPRGRPRGDPPPTNPRGATAPRAPHVQCWGRRPAAATAVELTAVDAEKEYAQSGQDFFECDIQSLRCVT